MNGEVNKEIKDAQNTIKLNNKKTSLKKLDFIREIENGLGEEIKKNPNRIEYSPPEPQKKPNMISRMIKTFFNLF